MKIVDNNNRPTHAGKAVDQLKPTAPGLLRTVRTSAWTLALKQTITICESRKHEIARKRDLARVPVSLHHDSHVAVAEDPNHPIHYNGEGLLGPHPDVMPTKR